MNYYLIIKKTCVSTLMFCMLNSTLNFLLISPCFSSDKEVNNENENNNTSTVRYKRKANQKPRISRRSAPIRDKNECLSLLNPTEITTRGSRYLKSGTLAGVTFARQCFEISGTSGDPEAYYYLARLHLDGVAGFEPSQLDAHELFLKSARMGSARSAGVVGMSYLGQSDIEPDDVKAAYWLSVGARSLDSRSFLGLGFMHLYGWGGFSQNFNKAFNNFKAAADSGSAQALVVLSVLHLTGVFGFVGESQVNIWLAEAINQFKNIEESPLFNYAIGKIFEKGQKGINQSYDAAFHHYLAAAKLGHARSIRLVVLAYTEGLGVEKNLELAEEWQAIGLDLRSSDRQLQLELSQLPHVR